MNKVLMIGIDRDWFRNNQGGDLLERHLSYVNKANCLLYIIVFTKRGFRKRIFNKKITIYPTNSFSKLNYIFDALKIIRKNQINNKFDLIICQDPFLTGLAGWLIKRKMKISLLIHFHGDFWDNKYWLFEKGRWWFNWFFLLLSKFLVKKADGIRVVSSGIKDKLIKQGIDKKKIKVIPTPIDLEKFIYCDPTKVKEIKNKIQEDRKTIINVGRSDPAKDYNTLLKAIDLVRKKYGKIAFWQIGANLSLENKIKIDDNLIAESIGKINQEELTNYYHAANIYVSSSKHESFGKVLIEAMAAGLPVVATETTGSKEIISDKENGFLVPIGDSEAIARKILYLLNNPDKADEMGRKGRQIAKEKFNQKKIIEKMINFWQELSKK